MSFEDELNAIAKVSTGGNYISEPCVELVTIKSYQMSPSDHKGCPYIQFTFETNEDVVENRRIHNQRLYRVQEGDSEIAIEIKNKKLKELLSNAGADFTLKGEEVIKSAVDNQVNALFKNVEKIGVDGNNNNKPIIKTMIEYSFSSVPSRAIEGKQSYLFTPLNAKNLAKYNAELAKWERDNPSGGQVATPTQTIADDNAPTGDGLPF